MSDPVPHNSDTGNSYAQIPFAAAATVGLLAIVATYLLAMSSIYDLAKTIGFLCIVAAFLTVSAFFYFSQRKRSSFRSETTVPDDLGIEQTLSSLDEANELFAGSLNTSDAFRLIASRVKELVPFRTMSLWMVDRTKAQIRIVEADGADVEFRKGEHSGLTEGLAGRAYHSQIVEIHSASPPSLPAVAIPLSRGEQQFGVLEFEFEMSFQVSALDRSLLEAIGSRTAPLILSSLSYEQSRSNALTDPITDLPNDRAFRLVLENQIAESYRKGNERPLTILALDVRSFDDINHRFGHAVGDRVLNFVGNVVKDNMRHMDFFARAAADEFLVILPTASKEVSHEVVARIHTGFFGRKLKVTDTESVEIELNIGWASFGTDGETPEALLRVARERKKQAKSTTPSKVIWFPTEIAG